MSQKRIATGILILMGFLFIAYLVNNTEPLISDNVDKKNDVLTNEPFASVYIKENQQKQNAQSKTSLEEQLETEAFAEQFAILAEQYEQQARYPSFSIPVRDIELAKTPEPFTQARVEITTFDEEGKLLPLSISASVDKLNYLVGEPISFQLLLSGTESTPSVFAEVSIKEADGNRTIMTSLPLEAKNASMTEFNASINSADLNIEDGSQELLAVVNLQIDGEQHLNTVPFNLSHSSAMLNGVSSTKQLDEYLEITLDYDVEEAGYYFVSAYLDDAASNRPLVALQSEGRMSTGSAELVLKAHHHALKDMGSSGPYKLRVTRSFRGAQPGEGNDVLTGISQASYAIPDISFTGFSDTPYSSPQVKAQIKALKELAGNGS